MMTLSVTGINKLQRDVFKGCCIDMEMEYHSVVNEYTDYLITNDKNSRSSQMLKAKKYGAKIINYDEFMLMVLDNMIEDINETIHN